MMKENKNSNEVLYEQIKLVNKYFNDNIPIPLEDKKKTLLMIGMAAKISEKNTISHISRLDVRHNCYPTLQQSYRIISKEASLALHNPTDDNLAIIMGQFGILQNLEEYLKQEDKIPLEILMEMNARTIKGIKASEKVFKKINNISVK